MTDDHEEDWSFLESSPPEEVAAVVQRLNAAGQLVTRMAPVIAEELRAFEAQAPILLATVADYFRRLPPIEHMRLIMLARHGWYPARRVMPWSLVPDAAKKLSRSETREEAHEMLAEHFESNLSAYAAYFVDSYPERTDIIGQAVGAIRERRYAVAIPTLLAQVDGVTKQHIGVGFYEIKKANRKRKRARLSTGEQRRSLEGLLLLAKVPLPVTAGPKQRTDPEQLYRHSVMHGESTTYGTRLNAFRSISLLAYVTGLLCELGHVDEWVRTR